MYIRSATGYRAEYWSIKVNNIKRMESIQMRILRMIFGKTLKNTAKNELMVKMTGVEILKKFLRSQRLRWFGDVERMSKKKTNSLFWCSWSYATEILCDDYEWSCHLIYNKTCLFSDHKIYN